jgi:hypothetical protein
VSAIGRLTARLVREGVEVHHERVYRERKDWPCASGSGGGSAGTVPSAPAAKPNQRWPIVCNCSSTRTSGQPAAGGGEKFKEALSSLLYFGTARS